MASKVQKIMEVIKIKYDDTFILPSDKRVQFPCTVEGNDEGMECD